MLTPKAQSGSIHSTACVGFASLRCNGKAIHMGGFSFGWQKGDT